MNIYLPDPLNTRQSMNEDDWGDFATVGKHLKKRKSFYDLKEGDFGIFLGEKEGKIVIGIKNQSSDIKEYDSIEDAKKEWILD